MLLTVGSFPTAPTSVGLLSDLPYNQTGIRPTALILTRMNNQQFSAGWSIHGTDAAPTAWQLVRVVRVSGGEAIRRLWLNTPSGTNFYLFNWCHGPVTGELSWIA